MRALGAGLPSSVEKDLLIHGFHRFGQAKFAYGGSILGSSQYTLLPQLPLKMMLNLSVVQIDFENIHLTSIIYIRDTLRRLQIRVWICQRILLSILQ